MILDTPIEDILQLIKNRGLVRELAKDVTLDNDLIKLGDELINICKQKNGIGLHAVQVGLPINFFVANMGKWRYFANFEYIPCKYSRKVDSYEGCLSLPNKLYKVRRWDIVEVEGYEFINKKWRLIKQYVANDRGFVYQHEIDHANNILISEIGEQVDGIHCGYSDKSKRGKK